MRTGPNILILGGSGFVGGHLVGELARRGARVTVPTRRPQRARHLLVFPTVEVVAADVHDDATLAGLVHGHDAVVNLVGVLKGGNGKPWGPGFERAHVALPRRLAHAAAAGGVARLLHVSALKADAAAPSQYLRSKAAGEAALREAFPLATVFRPSVLFGRGDAFLTLFAALARLAPLLPLACPAARFQPVWVEDVAATLATSLDRNGSAGQTHELCGPRVYTLAELVALAARAAGTTARIWPLGDIPSYLQAWATELVGGPMTRDNYWSMQLPSTCDGECGALPFGRRATPLEVVAPAYLGGGTGR